MYDFNIIENDGKNHQKKHSFSIDAEGAIYRKLKIGITYFLTMDEIRLIHMAGGLDVIHQFLKETNYKDSMENGGLKVINLNP